MMKRVSGGFGIAGAVVFLLTTILAVPAGAATLQPLTGVRSVATGYGDSCALLTSGQVDCWGYGASGQLGNGTFYKASPYGPHAPVAVKGVDGTGRLSDVAGLTGDGYGYCALLTSRQVDCWGYGASGALGNGTFYTSGNEGSAVPVAVKGVGGSGTLGGVASLTSDSYFGYCALLTSGNVDCWGNGFFGELGNGTFYTSGNEGSALPVAVKGVGGAGTLSGVASLTSDSYYGSVGYGDCARLTSGQVDCWGAGYAGQLGNGMFYTTGNDGSALPVAVVGVGGSGMLMGVASLSSDGIGYCALLTSGHVDCWGNGLEGELGNGTFYTTSPYGSAVPVAVLGVGGTGALGEVVSLRSNSGTTSSSYCARLSSGQVDCWGNGLEGELGNGTFYTTGNDGSAVPVAVLAVGGSGSLGSVATLTSDGEGYCARLSTGQADCWGYGQDGQLGNGTFYTTGNDGSAVPVVVLGVGGTGSLGGVATLAGDTTYGFCALLTSGMVDCWGNGQYGQLGNGSFYPSSPYGSAVPVAVVT